MSVQASASTHSTITSVRNNIDRQTFSKGILVNLYLPFISEELIIEYNGKYLRS